MMNLLDGMMFALACSILGWTLYINCNSFQSPQLAMIQKSQEKVEKKRKKTYNLGLKLDLDEYNKGRETYRSRYVHFGDGQYKTEL